MATYYIDPNAAINGSGASKDSPYNAPPTLVAGNEYLFKDGSVWAGRTSSWSINLANITLGVYDATTGDRVTDGSKWATFDWRNTLLATSSAVVFGANCAVGLDVQGLIVMSGWFVNNNGVTYQSILSHTSSADNEPGVGASWATNWIAHDTFMADAPAWGAGIAYQRNTGSGIAANIASLTNCVLKHIRTVGNASGISMINVAGIVTPTLEDVICTMTWGAVGLPIGGTSASRLSNPTIKNVYCHDAKGGYGVGLQYITGSSTGMEIDGVGGQLCKSGGIVFRFVTGTGYIRNIDGQHSAASGVVVDSGCSGIVLDGVCGNYSADNGFSGVDLFSPGTAPVNCEVRKYQFLYCGDVERFADNPANDGDGFSCHAGTGWVFDTGFSCRNLNSGAAHVGGSTGVIRNSVLVQNGRLPDLSPAPSEYQRGGLALVDSGGWVLDNCIIDENLPYDFKLSSPALLTADTNLIGNGTSTVTATTTATPLDRTAFIAAVIAGGGTCGNVVAGESLLNPADDFAPLAGSASIGTGKGVGIGAAGIDYEGNQRPAPSGDYNLGHREDYSPPKEGFGPWVHFDGTIPSWEE